MNIHTNVHTGQWICKVYYRLLWKATAGKKATKKPQTFAGWGFAEPWWKIPEQLVVPRARIELARAQGPRDFKSRVSTSSTIQAKNEGLKENCLLTTLLLPSQSKDDLITNQK